MIVDRCAAKQNDGASVNVRMSSLVFASTTCSLAPKVDTMAASRKAAQSSLC